MEIIQLSAQTAYVNLEESGAAVLDLNLPAPLFPLFPPTVINTDRPENCYTNAQMNQHMPNSAPYKTVTKSSNLVSVRHQSG